MDEALHSFGNGTQNTALATLLNAAWPSSRVCCRKVEIFQLEQHLTRRKIRERARRPCRAANQILPCRKSNFAAGFLGSKCCGSKAATRLYIHFEWDRAARQLFASFGVNAGMPRYCDVHDVQAFPHLLKVRLLNMLHSIRPDYIII